MVKLILEIIINYKLWLVIDDYLEKIKIIGIVHRTRHDGVQKTYDRIK